MRIMLVSTYDNTFKNVSTYIVRSFKGTIPWVTVSRSTIVIWIRVRSTTGPSSRHPSTGSLKLKLIGKNVQVPRMRCARSSKRTRMTIVRMRVHVWMFKKPRCWRRAMASSEEYRMGTRPHICQRPRQLSRTHQKILDYLCNESTSLRSPYLRHTELNCPQPVPLPV